MDFFFWGREDGAIGEGDAAWLVEQIRADGRTDPASGLELLLRVVLRAERCPEALRRLAREAILADVVRRSGGPVGEGRAGAIGRRDVEAIRRLVYGLGGEAGPVVGAGEAEWLIALDHATAAADNALKWRELFVKAVAMHLLHAGESPDPVDAAKARWLLERLDRGRGPTANGRALVAFLAQEGRYVDARVEALAPPRPPAGATPVFGRKGLAPAGAWPDRARHPGDGSPRATAGRARRASGFVAAQQACD